MVARCAFVLRGKLLIYCYGGVQSNTNLFCPGVAAAALTQPVIPLEYEQGHPCTEANISAPARARIAEIAAQEGNG